MLRKKHNSETNESKRGWFKTKKGWMRIEEDPERRFIQERFYSLYDRIAGNLTYDEFVHSIDSSEAKAHLYSLVKFIQVAEDLGRVKSKRKNQRKLKKLVTELKGLSKAVNNIPTYSGKPILKVGDDGDIKADFELKKLEDDTIRFGEEHQGYAANAIEKIKDLLADPRWRPLLGICHYEKCKKPLYLKKRKDEQYCSKTHSILAWKLLHPNRKKR